MTIEITQKDILNCNGTENLFKLKNYVLDENTDIVMNGEFDNGVLYDFFDFLKVKSYFINSITAPECETLPGSFFVKARLVKKIIIREGTRFLQNESFAGCDIETLVLPKSFELITKSTFKKSAIRHIEFNGDNKTENAHWIVKEKGLYNKGQDVCLLSFVKYPVSRMPYLSFPAISYATEGAINFLNPIHEDRYLADDRNKIIQQWKQPVADLKAKILSSYEQNKETLTLDLIGELCGASPYSKLCIDVSHKMIERTVPGFYRRNNDNLFKLRSAFDNKTELPKSFKDYFLYHRPYADPRNIFMIAIFSSGIEIYNVYYSLYAFLEKSEINAFPEFMYELTNMLPYKPVIVPVYDENNEKIGEREFHGEKI